jgi:hypothetical protein
VKKWIGSAAFLLLLAFAHIVFSGGSQSQNTPGITFKNRNSSLQICAVHWYQGRLEAQFYDAYQPPLAKSAESATIWLLEHTRRHIGIANVQRVVSISKWLESDTMFCVVNMPLLIVYAHSPMRDKNYFEIVNDAGEQIGWEDDQRGRGGGATGLILIFRVSELTNGLYHLSHCGTNYADIQARDPVAGRLPPGLEAR